MLSLQVPLSFDSSPQPSVGTGRKSRAGNPSSLTAREDWGGFRSDVSLIAFHARQGKREERATRMKH